jgi:hypothetical protein
MMEAARTSETSVENHFTWQNNPEDNSEHHTRHCENLKSHIFQHVILLPKETTQSLAAVDKLKGTLLFNACNKN